MSPTRQYWAVTECEKLVRNQRNTNLWRSSSWLPDTMSKPLDTVGPIHAAQWHSTDKNACQNKSRRELEERLHNNLYGRSHVSRNDPIGGVRSELHPWRWPVTMNNWPRMSQSHSTRHNLQDTIISDVLDKDEKWGLSSAIIYLY